MSIQRSLVEEGDFIPGSFACHLRQEALEAVDGADGSSYREGRGEAPHGVQLSPCPQA